MKSERILNALGQVDETYIEEAAPDGAQRIRKHRWVKWGALAACLCLAIGGAVLFLHRGSSSTFDTGITVSDSGVTLPPANVTLGKQEGVEMCWAYEFFIYQGRCYKGYETVYDDVDLIGEYLGTAIGLIDVWTPKEGYVELAGNISGDFYSVNGYDPGFLLCMRESDGGIQIFINDNDLTLKYGADLFEDRFLLSDNLEEVQYQTRASWYDSTDEIFALTSEAEPVVADFITALNCGLFMREEDVPPKNGQSYLSQADLYHVTFCLNNGITIPLRLAEGGYVHFSTYFGGVCVKIDEEAFNAFIALLESGTSAVPAQSANDRYSTLEDCLNDAYFGSYVPSYIPDGMQFEYATISYVIEPKTGELLKTKEIWLNYSSERDPNTSFAEMEYSIELFWTEDYGGNGWAGTVLDPAQLTPEAIGALISTTYRDGTPRTQSQTSFGVRLGDVTAALYAYGLDADSSYQIMASIIR